MLSVLFLACRANYKDMIGEPEARRGRSNPRLAEVGVNHAVYVTILIFYSTLAVRNTSPPPLSNHQSDLLLHATLKNCYVLFRFIAILLLLLLLIPLLFSYLRVLPKFFLLFLLLFVTMRLWFLK